MLQSQYTSNSGHLLDSLTGLFSPVDYKCPKCPVHCMCYVCSGRKWLFSHCTEHRAKEGRREDEIQLNHWIRFLRLDWRLILWSAHTSLWLRVKKKQKSLPHRHTHTQREREREREREQNSFWTFFHGLSIQFSRAPWLLLPLALLLSAAAFGGSENRKQCKGQQRTNELSGYPCVRSPNRTNDATIVNFSAFSKRD